MDNPKRFISPSLFILILICFSLPFVSISCGQMELTVNGYQLATGATVDGQQIDAEPLAMIALLAAIIGLVCGFLWNRSARLAAAVMGVIGFLSVLALRIQIGVQVHQEAVREGLQGLISTKFGAGFFMPLILFLAAAGANALFMKQGETVQPSQEYFCPQCGAKIGAGEAFCGQCGTNLTQNIGG